NSVKKSLDRLLTFGHLKIEIPNVTLEIGVVEDTGYCVPSTKQAFEFHLGLLLSMHAPRIRKCSECKRTYLAVRRKQQFCSIKCQNRNAARLFRLRSKERAMKKSGKLRSKAGIKGKG
ncbi:MAG: hypothetical protein VST66_05765, partial [Nitrospirota bacterium]|nr:hypothetical protein [Nitrospirota bacterium]